ncbi:transporter [Sphingomonas aracearum]|uniref:Transporter n=2 Tax=Sphingomonas aracearum TaxID=2283317 RepID=A0A369VRH7_9SPHN|nr:transporter [Sphingomonas aracearum]
MYGLVLASVANTAATASPGDPPLTIETAARQVVSWHPAVIEASGVVGQADAEVSAARAGYSPIISAGLGSGYDSRVSGTWRPRPQIGAQQMLFDFGKVSSAVESARAGTRIGRAELLLAVDTLVRDTSYALIELQRSIALRDVAREQAERIADISKLVGERSDKGAATRSDALQAQARVEAAQATLSQIEAEVRRWSSNLAYLMNRQTVSSVSADVPDWLMRSCTAPMPAWSEIPSVMVAEARADQAGAEVRRNRAERYPTLSLGGDASTDFASPFGDRSIYNFGLRVSSNIFGGGVTGARVRGAEFARGAAEAAATRARLDTSQRMAEAQQQIESLARLNDTLASRTASMKETGRLYQLQYLQMGTRTLVDLLNAEQELQQVRFEAVNNAHDLRRLQTDCLFLSGRTRDAFGLTGTSIGGVTL